MPILERDGARILYEISGDESGPPILLGHSLLCDARMWELVAPELEKRWRVININARGHGGSTAPGPFTLEDLAADWLAILDKERIDKAVLCGLSMGGMTALRVALAAPERVRGLIIMDSSADPEIQEKRIQYRAMMETIRSFGHLGFIYKIVKRIMFGRTTVEERPAIADRTVARFKQNDPHQLYHAVRAIIDRGSIAQQITGIQKPTLVLVGNEDRATPPFRSERMAAAIKGARLRYIPQAGHLSALEQPAAILHEIDDFAKTLTSGA